MVLVLAVLLFGRRLELVAATWALLAFGDGAAALVGRRLPLARLPWNPDKSSGGVLAFVLVGGAACAAALQWTTRGALDPGASIAAAGLGASVAAAVESIPGSLDDNWTASLLGAGAAALLLADPARLGVLVAWLAASALVAALVTYRGWLSRDGALAAAVVGGALGAGLGWRGWTLLALFFASGVAATGPGGADRRRPGRGGDQVLANGAVAAFAALLAAATGSIAFRLASVAALAEAAVDTVSGEVGQRLGAPARLVTDGRRVPPGTDGAVSWAGTGVGLAVAALYAGAALAVGTVGPAGAGAVAVAATLGAGLDSLLGATLESSGRLDNQGVNLISTAWAALIAGWWSTL